jgi:hypothetical protein
MIDATCGCGAKYRVPDHFAGKRAKCKKCGDAIPIPVPQTQADDDTFALEDDGLFGEMAAAAQRGAAVSANDATPPPPIDLNPPSAAPRSVATAGGFPSFWKDVTWSLFFIGQPGSILTFLIVAAIYAVEPLAYYGGCVGLIGMLIINGWMAAFLFKIVQNAAGGKKDLPSFSLTEGLMDDVIAPFFKFLTTCIVVLVPSITYVLVTGAGEDFAEKGTDGDLLFLATIGLGSFLWPMVVLVVAIGGVGSLFRMDLILITIGKTFVPYLFTFVLTCLVVVLMRFAQSLIQGSNASQNPVAMSMVLNVVVLYFFAVNMFVIGFYYRNFKNRFAWSWE